MVSQLFGLVGKVVRIDADAVSSHQPRTEAEGVPLGVHAVNDLIGVNIHAVEYHCQLVHERNIDVALAVLNHLYSLRRSDIGDGVGSGINHKLVHIPDLLQGFPVTARNDFADCFQPVDLISRVDALG